MKRLAALAWLGIVLLASLYLVLRVMDGHLVETNLLALLPRAEQDRTLQQAKDKVAENFSRRVVLLVGNVDPARARAAARDLAGRLERSVMTSSVTFGLTADMQRRTAAAYFPYRSGLLSAPDRAKLESGSAKEIVDRALSVVFGPGGAVDGRLLKSDPFLLMGGFLADLPLPESRLVNEDGVLMVKDGDRSYAFLTAILAEDAFSLAFQERFSDFLDKTIGETTGPDFTVLKTGAIFYARDGAQRASRETSLIGIVSLAGTILLIALVFGSLRPVWLSLLTIGVGILCGLSFCFWVFQELHVVSMLLGVSLIGISVDYSLEYCCEYFDPSAASGKERLHHVLPGVSLGLLTTLIGYLTLMLAPFPGLRQVALFSVTGLIASFLTVALWYPLLDPKPGRQMRSRLLRVAESFWRISEAPAYRTFRRMVATVLCAVAVLGFFELHADDDVRHLQGAPASLRAEEQEIQRLTGLSGGSQFLLIRAADTEEALETEETLRPRLEAAKQEGLIRGYLAASQIVPSMARQKDNRMLVRSRLLDPYLKDYLDRIGLDETPQEAAAPDAPFLKPSGMAPEGPSALVASLMADNPATGAVHIIPFNGATDLGRLRRIFDGIPNVSFVDPVADISTLFGKYRVEALMLLALSAFLMLPLLFWRYGISGGCRVIAPSAAAVCLTPPIVALFGGAFTFFNAMALVLVMSIGIDYSVFCRETEGLRKNLTMLAITLCALSTILSFGLLALSGLFVVHAFGLTVLIGITLAFLLAPAARGGLS